MSVAPVLWSIAPVDGDSLGAALGEVDGGPDGAAVGGLVGAPAELQATTASAKAGVSAMDARRRRW
jgi:hypothetical protein